MIKDNILLKVRNVKKYFNTPSGVVNAIDDISFDVKEGEIIGLIGESGSGKTTVGRCLIRLYDGYSGYVGLDGQAISGNKLNRAKKMFLNQNMQMIFQDPHASLNGQQNIFTILKEPLMVNKIMKKEYKDFFSDWEKVIDNFKYEFAEEVRKIELDTVIYHTSQAELLLKEWIDIFRRIKFRYSDIENDFNQYFAYKLSTQEREGNVINRIFTNNSKILDLYFDHQNKFRNDQIIDIEKELKAKRNDYEQKVADSKINSFNKKRSSLYYKKKNELKNLYKERNSQRINNLNILNSYIFEFKNIYLSHIDKARNKTTFDQYNEEIKFYLLAKRIYHDLNRNKLNLVFLSSEKIDELIASLKKYHDEFTSLIETAFKPTNAKVYKRELKQYIENNFNFDLSQYINKSKDAFDYYEYSINRIKKEITQITWTLDIKNNEEPISSISDVDRAYNEYIKVQEKYDEVVKDYSVKWQKRMDEYRNEMIIQFEKLNSIRNELAKIDAQFDQKHEEFIEGLKNHLKQKGESESKIRNHINIYENKVRVKKETLKAFNVEILNLKKDLNKLKELLGLIKTPFSKKNIKKILIKEKIYKALEEVGLLRQFAWRYPHEFSGGQRQRIVIARALISNPKIIIADEPIASLDVSIQAQVVNILKDLCERKNVSLIFIAHDLSMVEYIADKILIMHLGKIVEFGKTEEIYSFPAHPYTINLFKSMPKISNAADKFESSNFELHYLDEQNNNKANVDFFELNENHYIYSTPEQFRTWTKMEPKICEYTKNRDILK